MKTQFIPTLKAFSEVCKAISSSLVLSQTLELIAKKAAEALSLKAASIRLLDNSGKKLIIKAAYGLSKEYLQKGPVEIEKSRIDKDALSSGEEIIIHEAVLDDRWQYTEEAYREGICSVLVVPLNVDGKNLGVLRVYSATPHEFIDYEIHFIKALADQGAIAIKNAIIYERLTTLYDISKSIGSILNLKGVMEKLVESANNCMDSKCCVILLFDKKTNNFEIGASIGFNGKFPEEKSLEFNALVSKIINGELLSLSHVKEDITFNYNDRSGSEVVMSLLAVPLKVKDKVIGILKVYSEGPKDYNQDEIQFLNALAAYGAISIENARLFEHVKHDYETLMRDVWQWYDWGETHPIF